MVSYFLIENKRQCIKELWGRQQIGFLGLTIVPIDLSHRFLLHYPPALSILTNNIFYGFTSRNRIKRCFVLLELSSSGTVGMFAINGEWWSLLFGTSGMRSIRFKMYFGSQILENVYHLIECKILKAFVIFVNIERAALPTQLLPICHLNLYNWYKLAVSTN